ncbi:MAG: flagellar biosynthetic protein FliO [Planctomycetota bacterium]
MNRVVAVHVGALFILAALCGARAEGDPAYVRESPGEAVGAEETAGPASGEASEIEKTKVFEGGSREDFVSGPKPPYVEMLKLAVSLGVVLALIVVCAWAFRRWAPRTASGFSSDTLKVIARTYLGPRQMVCLVRVPGRLLVVGSTQSAIATLAEISDPVEIEKVLASFEKRSAGSATETFRNLFASVTRGGSDGEGELAETVKNVTRRVASLTTKLEAYNREMN